MEVSDSSTVWASLTRTGGNENAPPLAPDLLHLCGPRTVYIGRTPIRQQPAQQPGNPSPDNAPEKQLVIPCLFVSASHFSIQRNVRDHVVTYEIADYSKNGTFLVKNGERVAVKEGNSRSREIQDGDEISLDFKGVTRLQYRFDAISNEFNATNISMASEANHSIDVFEQQISVLKEENAELEARLASKEQQIEVVTKDLDLANRKSRSLQGQVESNEREFNDLNDKVREAEGNAHAVEARNCKLQESLEEAKSESTKAKSKIASLAEDLKHKASQLDNRQNLMNDVNTALGKEKYQRNQKEAECRKLGSKIEEQSSKLCTLNTANAALQRVITGFEHAYATAQEKNKSMLGVLTKVVAEEDCKDKRLSDLQTKLGEMQEKLTSIMSAFSSTIVNDIEGSLLGSAGSMKRMIGDVTQFKLEEVDVYNSLASLRVNGKSSDGDKGTTTVIDAAKNKVILMNGDTNDDVKGGVGFFGVASSSSSSSSSPPPGAALPHFVGPVVGKDPGQWDETNISQNGSFTNCFINIDDDGAYDLYEMGGGTQVPPMDVMGTAMGTAMPSIPDGDEEEDDERGGDGDGKGDGERHVQGDIDGTITTAANENRSKGDSNLVDMFVEGIKLPTALPTESVGNTGQVAGAPVLCHATRGERQGEEREEGEDTGIAKRNEEGEQEKEHSDNIISQTADNQNVSQGNRVVTDHSEVLDKDNILHLIQPVVVDHFASSQFSDSVVLPGGSERKRADREEDSYDEEREGLAGRDNDQSHNYDGGGDREEETSFAMSALDDDYSMHKKQRF